MTTGQVIGKCKWCLRVITIPEIANENDDGTYEHPGCYYVNTVLHDWQSDVQKFHAKFGIPIGTTPKRISDNRLELRISLIQEDMKETIRAIDDVNLVEIADGICDSIYVLLGTAIEFGIDISPIWNEVQRTNMAKDGGTTRTDEKILKPEGWEPPRVYEELLVQGMEV